MKKPSKVYFVRIDNDYLEDAKRFSTKQKAIDYFLSVASELNRYGQRCEGSIHIATKDDSGIFDRFDDLSEYPDFVLSLGSRGGVQVVKA